MLKKLTVIILSLLFASTSFADYAIIGRVVGISDGDTIKVLQNQKTYKIRLYGIDTPESKQEFGNKAKQYTSNAVFKKTVRVIVKDKDRYGRLVGVVYIKDFCLNKQLIINGLAWVYPAYCKINLCSDWNKYEEKAKKAQKGLWSHKNPIPPWDFRKGIHKPKTDKPGEVSTFRNYHGNTKSKIFHSPKCRYYNCRNCTKNFKNQEAAIKEGYRHCKICKP